MKVIILTNESFPNGMAATQRIKCYGQAIVSAGIDCEVVIFRRTEKYGVPVNNSLRNGKVNSLPFHYIPSSPKRGSNVFIRQLNDVVDLRKTELYLKHNLKKGDILFLYMGGQVKKMLRFMSVARSVGAFCVRDLCEYPYVIGEETNKNLKLRNLTLYSQFPQLDGIVCISNQLMQLSAEHVSPNCKLLKVPVMVDYAKQQSENMSDKASLPYIFHSGTLTEQKDGILGLIEAFGISCQRKNFNVRLFCTGLKENSPHCREIDMLINKYGLEDKLLFTGYLSNNELEQYLSKAYLCVVNKYSNVQNKYNFSNKLGEYSAASKPLVLTNVGEAVNYFVNGKSALFVNPGNVEELVDAICWALDNPDEMRQMGHQAQLVCENNFDFRLWGIPLRNFFLSLSQCD